MAKPSITNVLPVSDGIYTIDGSASIKGDTYTMENYQHIRNLPPCNFASYRELAEELGEDFEVLAPKLYAEWKEIKAIHDYRKTLDLIGGSDESRP